MKKSFIGMLLLGVMVLTRALLLEQGEDVEFKLVRSNSFYTTSQDFIALHNEISPKQNLQLFAHNFESEDIDVVGVSGYVPDNREYQDSDQVTDRDLIARQDPVTDDVVAESEEDVIPMDYVSDTGYGLWNPGLSSDKQKSEQGDYPLDRGSTISDNINRLFPLKTPY